MAKPFELKFSNRVIEHLGIKLYQNKPTNVVAEFLSNSWDADAFNVQIELKAQGAGGKPIIVITDDGRGMTRDELTDEFLIIGRNRRGEPTERTPAGRLPMGRKGIGKLAGFGIAGTVDVISSPNIQLRRDADIVAQSFYWLRFSLQELIAKSTASLTGSYEPEVIADGVNLNVLQDLVINNGCEEECRHFLENSISGKGGVCIILRNTTLKKAMNVESLIQSTGRRFTVAMLRPEFIVRVNGKPITPDAALPALHDFGFGDWNTPVVETLVFNGVERTVKYWIKFVSLQGENWSIENAGIGVYAHGKIAQDRPFFFDVKGKEILSRYLYGVIEADWLDELPTDVVSTDRRSIDWDTDETIDFQFWGNNKISYWLEEFRKWKGRQPKKEIVDRIRSVSYTHLTLPTKRIV